MVSTLFFSPIHRTYFCARLTDGAARIYFSPLFISPGTEHLLVEECCAVREREVRKNKEEEEKSPEKTTSPGPGIEPTDS
jgi:hypothetical protein